MATPTEEEPQVSATIVNIKAEKNCPDVLFNIAVQVI
jgi:hypothetical protein